MINDYKKRYNMLQQVLVRLRATNMELRCLLYYVLNKNVNIKSKKTEIHIIEQLKELGLYDEFVEYSEKFIIQNEVKQLTDKIRIIKDIELKGLSLTPNGIEPDIEFK